MKNKTEMFFKLIFAVLLILYIPLLLRITLMQDGVRTASGTIRTIPFNAVSDYLSGEKTLKFLIVNYLGNIFLFLPFGLLFPSIFKKLTFFKVLLLGILISLAVEATQYLTCRGYADIDDVIMNAAGTVIGYVIYKCLNIKKMKPVLSGILTLIVIAAFAVAGVEATHRIKPEFLPESMIVRDGKIAGKPLKSPDYEISCKKMSHGEVFFYGNKVAQSLYIADTAIFVVHRFEEDGEDIYSVVGIEEMIELVNNSGGCNMKLWKDQSGECNIILADAR